ncbi:MAG: hypothetical protein HYY93_11225 [Planctomycetes bacterium]|nr:hypothetical protein [Planctomycetota bacterium]
MRISYPRPAAIWETGRAKAAVFGTGPEADASGGNGASSWFLRRIEATER